MDYIYDNNEEIDDRIRVFCMVMDSLVNTIKKPKRIHIIKIIYEARKPLTIKEIEEKIEFSNATLYDNLRVLCLQNVISKNDDRPYKYFLSDFFKGLIGIKD